MNQSPTASGPTRTRRSRSHPTREQREATRLTHALADVLGRSVRDARRRARLTQAQVATRIGVHQSLISRVELGRGGVVALEVWVAIGVALGRPLAVSLSRPLGEPREPADAGHLAMQERLLALARATGRTATFELPTRSGDPRYSIDVCVRDDRHRVLLIVEAWNTFGDLGAAIRSTNRKVAEALDLAELIGGDRPYGVAAVWVIRSSVTNRGLVRRYPQILRSAFPGSSRTWVRALGGGSAAALQPGLVWLDPASGRVSALRLRARRDQGGQRD